MTTRTDPTRRWLTAGAVRWVVGVAVALAAGRAATTAGEGCRRWLRTDAAVFAATDAFLLVGLVGGAVVYRRATRAVIRWASLFDPSADDRFGPTPGHAGRAALFCQLLGLGVFATTDAILNACGWHVGGVADAKVDALRVLAPVTLGWLTYRLGRRRLLPRGHSVLPAGGFPVVTASEPDAEVVANARSEPVGPAM